MDSLLGTAARALASGAPLAALKYVALRDDPPALALRGIALAQLGDFARARRLLVRAERAFGAGQAVARARCVVARVEIDLARRELSHGSAELAQAAEVLAAHGELGNAAFARLVELRRLVLLGRLDEAERALTALALGAAPAHVVAVAELVAADLAVRRLSTRTAAAALARARQVALVSRIPALLAEVERALTRLAAPAARLVAEGVERPLTLAEIEEVLGSDALVVDACRRELRAGRGALSFVTRPVLFTLALTLARAAPLEVRREALVAEAFAARRMNESHRARLRVELGRLRKVLLGLADVRATPNGFALLPQRRQPVLLILPLEPGEASALLGLLSGGEAWSTSGLAAALGKSQRSVQRALALLESDGKVQGIGGGRSRRWVSPPSTAFATTLLLVARGTLG